jgi:quercetin dioxygenase-like cupin family protein
MNTIETLEGTAVETSVVLQRAGQGKRLNVLGDQQTIKLSGKDTNGQFTIIENYNGRGVGIPMHVHDNEDEIFLILEGEMEFETQGETTILKQGDMIFLPRRIPHAFRVVGTQKARASVTIMPSGIEEMFEILSKLPAGQPDLEQVADICHSFGISFV